MGNRSRVLRKRVKQAFKQEAMTPADTSRKLFQIARWLVICNEIRHFRPSGHFIIIEMNANVRRTSAYDWQCLLAWYVNTQFVRFTDIDRFVLALVICRGKNVHGSNPVLENAIRIKDSELVYRSADAKKSSIADPSHEPYLLFRSTMHSASPTEDPTTQSLKLFKKNIV
jgi:hypothetical protein